MKKQEEMNSSIQKLDHESLSEVNGGAFSLIDYRYYPWIYGGPIYPDIPYINPIFDNPGIFGF